MVHDYSAVNAGVWPFLGLLVMVVGYLLLSVANIIGFRLIVNEPQDPTTEQYAEEYAAEHPAEAAPAVQEHPRGH